MAEKDWDAFKIPLKVSPYVPDNAHIVAST